MIPKEKAKELLNKFIPHTRVFHEVLGWEDYIDSAKQCALIAVDEIIEYAKRWGDMADDDIKEFEQVKNEINLL